MIVSALALENVRYLQRALAQWQQTEGEPAADEVARLSPLLYEQLSIIVYKSYAKKLHDSQGATPLAQPH